MKNKSQKQQSTFHPPSSQYSRTDLDPSKICQCRICLEISKEENQNQCFISPCKCTGSIKFVHTECLEKWVDKITSNYHKKIAGNYAEIHCQLCNSKILFKTRSVTTLKNLTEINHAFIIHYKLFIVLVIMLLASLGFFSALLNYLLFVGFKTLYVNNVVIVSLIITGQVIFSIVALVTLGAIIRKFFLKEIIKFQNIGGESLKEKL